MHVSTAPVVADVADRTRVDAAPPALDLGDELHRAYLRRPRDRAGGERRLEQRERILVGPEPALDLRDEVHDVRVSLDLQLLDDLDGSGVADAAEVVAGEVDEHEVLGALLLVVPQLLGERVVLGAVATALARARDRLQRRDPVARERHVRLGRCRDDLERAEVGEHHVRGGVHRAQRAVDGERRRGGRADVALRDDDLERVPRGDVLLGAADVALVLLRRHVRLRGGWAREPGDRPDAVGKRPHQLGGDGIGIAVAPGLGDHLDRAPHVVEDHDDVGDQEARGRRGVALLAVRQRDGRLEPRGSRRRRRSRPRRR